MKWSHLGKKAELNVSLSLPQHQSTTEKNNFFLKEHVSPNYFEAILTQKNYGKCFAIVYDTLLSDFTRIHLTI